MSMAVRVRKLAKEMNQPPGDVLGVLHALGFEKYRSLEDMIPDPMAEKVKRAWRDGVKPVPVALEAAPAPKRDVASTIEPRRDDLMARLVPGVTRGIHTPPEAKSRRPVPKARTEELGRSLEEAVAPDAVVEAERETLRLEREDAARLRQTLEEATQSLRQAEERVAIERRELADERASLETRRREGQDLPALLDLLQARGLRGSDETERAFSALASARLLGELLPRLRVDDPVAVGHFLKEKLILVGGSPPEGSSVAGVTVSPERADIPDAHDLQKHLARVSELLLLHGLRRLSIVGGRAVGHRMLRGLDSRIEVRLVPASGSRTRADAEGDVSRTDALVLWGVSADADARQVYATSRATLIEAVDPGVAALLQAVLQALGA
jgi:hypothetical protein